LDNENNRLIGLSIGDYEVGTYNNSYNTRSFYGAKRFPLDKKDRFGIMAGGVSGYNLDCVQGNGECKETDVLPMAAAYVRINNVLTALQMANAFMLTANFRLK
jgi:hypothetical protein